MNREDEICAQAINYCSGDKGSDARVRAAFYNGARWADKNPHWISVEDELPEHNEEDNGLIPYPTVLVCLYDGFRTEDYYDDISGEWRDFDGDVEYWMPMPQTPRKEVNNEKDNVQ